MFLHLLIFLSAAVLHSVSAGGSYCAKTAKARAAALGLKYPGDHGAPDFSGPAPNVLHPKILHYNNPALSEPSLAHHHFQPEAPSNDFAFEQAPPRSFHGVPPGHDAYEPKHTTNHMLISPRGRLVRDPESSSEVVNLNPRSHEPHSLIHDERDLAFDESDPNRPGVAPSDVPAPRSGFYAYHSAPMNTLGNVVPVLQMYRHLNKVRGGIPFYGNWKMVRNPVRFPHKMYQSQNVPPFAQDDSCKPGCYQSAICWSV